MFDVNADPSQWNQGVSLTQDAYDAIYLVLEQHIISHISRIEDQLTDLGVVVKRENT